jgi:hypothetical protein
MSKTQKKKTRTTTPEPSMTLSEPERLEKVKLENRRGESCTLGSWFLFRSIAGRLLSR